MQGSCSGWSSRALPVRVVTPVNARAYNRYVHQFQHRGTKRRVDEAVCEMGAIVVKRRSQTKRRLDGAPKGSTTGQPTASGESQHILAGKERLDLHDS